MSIQKKITAASFLGLLSMPLSVLAQWSTTGSGSSGFDNADSAGLPSESIYNIISNTLSWLLAVLGFIAIMGFVISGIQYLIAAGDEGMIERAKTNMKYSIVGVIVALMGFVFVQAIDSWLSAGSAF